ncbi:hypothetical protein DRH14_00565 [Candidatus Shapirobacteria bacterium]|nr:MAG: hypothetical protein DRH14_00565 [Candidatus Shapirobacteria bacterium]
MKQFRRPRLEKKEERDVRKSTVLVGLFTLFLFLVVVFLGVPFLVRFSIFLGETKKNVEVQEKDVLPPLAPRIFLPFEATNSAEIRLSGVAEAGIKIDLFKDGVKIDSLEVEDSGEFGFDKLELDEGENVFSAVAISKEDKKSPLSRELVVVYDKEAPEFEMTNPREESLTVDNAEFDIIGKTEKDASVLVNGRVAMVDNEGNFKFRMQLDIGENKIEIKVRDLAGNESKKEIKIKYDF